MTRGSSLRGSPADDDEPLSSAAGSGQPDHGRRSGLELPATFPGRPGPQLKAVICVHDVAPANRPDWSRSASDPVTPGTGSLSSPDRKLSLVVIGIVQTLPLRPLHQDPGTLLSCGGIVVRM